MAEVLPTAVAIRDYGTDCELLVARKYTPAVELNWDLLHVRKEGTARPLQAQPLQARALGRPWEAEIVPTYLALKPVQQDVMNFTPVAPVHITVLLLLAWKVWRSGGYTLEERCGQLDTWLPWYKQGTTGLLELARDMEGAQQSALPPVMSFHTNPLLTLSALLEMVECWKQSGQPVAALLQGSADLAAGKPVAALFQHEPKWWCC
jgi:hypothetical protein